jgi:hypothetical protein
MKDWVKEFTEDIFKEMCPKDRVIGEIPYGTEVLYENDKGERYNIIIDDGHYWGTFGLSNFWYWTNVKTGEKEHGYGNFYKI